MSKTSSPLHKCDPYIFNPSHRLTVSLIGCGGSGSRMLSELVKIHLALRGLGHPGLAVKAYDPDMVSESNMARQLFFPCDLEQNKASVLVNRVNRNYGLDWNAYPIEFSEGLRSYHMRKSYHPMSNIYISCVHLVADRRKIGQFLEGTQYGDRQPFEDGFYWLDLGNGPDFGQVVLGTIGKANGKLKNFLEVFPGVVDTPDQGPSCSLAMALGKQDLFVNLSVVLVACQMLWTLLRTAMIDYNVVFVNLNTLTITKKYEAK